MTVKSCYLEERLYLEKLETDQQNPICLSISFHLVFILLRWSLALKTIHRGNLMMPRRLRKLQQFLLQASLFCFQFPFTIFFFFFFPYIPLINFLPCTFMSPVMIFAPALTLPSLFVSHFATQESPAVHLDLLSVLSYISDKAPGPQIDSWGGCTVKEM